MFFLWKKSSIWGRYSQHVCSKSLQSFVLSIVPQNLAQSPISGFSCSKAICQWAWSIGWLLSTALISQHDHHQSLGGSKVLLTLRSLKMPKSPCATHGHINGLCYLSHSIFYLDAVPTIVYVFKDFFHVLQHGHFSRHPKHGKPIPADPSNVPFDNVTSSHATFNSNKLIWDVSELNIIRRARQHLPHVVANSFISFIKLQSLIHSDMSVRDYLEQQGKSFHLHACTTCI